MPANLKDPFGPSCCDGGACTLNENSAQSCGCDKGAKWTCATCKAKQALRAAMVEYGKILDEQGEYYAQLYMKDLLS